MPTGARLRRVCLGVAVLALALAGAVSAARGGVRHAAVTTPASPAPMVRVGGPEASVPALSTAHGFLGIATELNTIPILAGTPQDPDVPLVHLLAGLSPGAPPLLRLGGNSSDFSYWPVPGMAAPRYLYTLTPQWGADVHALLTALHGSAILGLNLELARADGADVASTEVADFDRYVGANLIDAFELGNEPEFYPWLQVGREGREHDPNVAYAERFALYGRVFSAIDAALGGAPVVGPGTGSSEWLSRVGTLLGDLPASLRTVTVHGYPLRNCSNLAHLTVGDFFRRASIQGLADSLHTAVRAAAAHDDGVRVDEINGVTCGGKAGFSNSFAEALWSLNVLPALWRAGVQGVNFQTIDSRGNENQVITARHTGAGWRVSVEPEYYGLLGFADVAPAGSRLLEVSLPHLADLYGFAVRAPDRSTRLVLTNVGDRTRTVAASLAGARGSGSVSLLDAASLNATGGATLAGRRLSARTGRLAGSPRLTTVRRSRRGVYAVRVPPHAAAILTVAP